MCNSNKTPKWINLNVTQMTIKAVSANNLRHNTWCKQLPVRQQNHCWVVNPCAGSMLILARMSCNGRTYTWMACTIAEVRMFSLCINDNLPFIITAKCKTIVWVIGIRFNVYDKRIQQLVCEGNKCKYVWLMLTIRWASKHNVMR